MKYSQQIILRTKLILFLFLLLYCQISLAAEKINFPQMTKDLKIMSTILDKIMNPDNDHFLNDGKTRAVYLEGHGVLFIFYEKLSPGHIIISGDGDEFLTDKYRFEKSRAKRVPDKPQKTKDDEDEEKIRVSKQIEVTTRTKKQKLGETRTKLAEFLGDYCGAMKQLSPSDQVTVIVISENSTVFRLNQWMTFQHQPESGQLVASVSFDDISAYRRDSISQETFLKRIQLKDEATSDLVDKDLQIMSNIFSVALQQKKESDLVVDNNISGIYLQNFGALFVLNFERNFRTKMLQVTTDYENLLRIINEEENHFVKKRKVLADELKQEVIAVLADYGHNLKQLKENEWIGVAVDLHQIAGKESEPSALFFKVRKKDAIAVNHAKINRNEFKKRVLVTSY